MDQRHPFQPDPPELGGVSLEQRHIVTADMSARHLGSGSVGVLATPAMILHMEGASMACVQPHLAPGQTTVGYIVNIRHLGPAAIGREIVVRSTVLETTGRRVRFRVECRDGDRLVGEGEHVRVVVDSAAFLEASEEASR